MLQFDIVIRLLIDDEKEAQASQHQQRTLNPGAAVPSPEHPAHLARRVKHNLPLQSASVKQAQQLGM